VSSAAAQRPSSGLRAAEGLKQKAEVGSCGAGLQHPWEGSRMRYLRPKNTCSRGLNQNKKTLNTSITSRRPVRELKAKFCP
jgi:beta-lactamase superfamily II metal-dependent hydrolase